MIVVDTSALMAIALDEAAADACIDSLEANDPLLISAATLTEILIVGARRGADEATRALLEASAFTIVPVDEARSRAAADAYLNWGKGFHAASLGYGDCFAYALAKERGCPLLYIGDDFAKTDIEPALA